LHGRQKGLRSHQKFNVGQLRWNHADVLETPFCSSTGFKRQEVLVAEVRGEFIKIGLEVDGLAGAEIIRFGTRLIREFAKIRLRSESKEESASPVPRVWGIDRPNIDILLLRAADG